MRALVHEQPQTGGEEMQAAGMARNAGVGESEGVGIAGREGGERRPAAAATAGAARRGRALPARSWMLAAMCVLGVLPAVRAGTFLSGSVRWERVNEKTARFDVVTYWRRSFSPFNNGQAQPGDQIDVIGQSTVSLDYGDGSPKHYLLATVTNINEDEDWLEAVTTYVHEYDRPYADKQMVNDFSDAGSVDAPITEQKKKAVYTPWTATLSGCCRYNSLTNDPDKPFLMRTHVNLESSSRSPDPRVLPTVSVKPSGQFKSSITAPLYMPDDHALRFAWCPQNQWTNPGENLVSLHSVTGNVTWKGSSTGWYHLCVSASVDNVLSEVDYMVYVLNPTTRVPTVSSVQFLFF